MMPHRQATLIGLPGPSCTFATCQALVLASREQKIDLEHSGNSWDNFNTLLCEGLNRCEAGEITHFALLHADVNPQDGWIDILAGELARRGAAFISAVCPIKDDRGLTSTAIGDPADDWNPLRRLTTTEILGELPETFDAADAGYQDYALLHNNGCCLLDLRDRRFFTADAAGDLLCAWLFPKRVRRSGDGRWAVQGESEDWYLSRRMFELGIPSVATRKVRLEHMAGSIAFPNDRAWGQRRDEHYRAKWAACPGSVLGTD